MGTLRGYLSPACHGSLCMYLTRLRALCRSIPAARCVSKKNLNAPRPSEYSGILEIFLFACLAGLLLFLTFSVLVANQKKLLYTVANPARGLLNREKRTKKEEVWQHTPRHTARSEKKKKKSRDASTGATLVSVGLASVQGYLRLVD